MPISGPSSYEDTINEVLAHWTQCLSLLPPSAPLVVRLPDNDAPVTHAQLVAKRDALKAQQTVVQSRRTGLFLQRATILLQKTALLEHFNQFTTLLDAKYQKTIFYQLRPLAPGLGYGKHAFCEPMVDAMILWEAMNEGPAPATVTLPVTLPNGTVQSAFASLISALAFSYAAEKVKDRDLILARGIRNQIQDEAYEILKWYRETVPTTMANFPVLIETMPRLTPLPGHTPDAVNSSAVYVAPDSSKVVYNASKDSMLASYQLRGNAGEEYSSEDAVVIATNEPGAPREFITPFGLNQPGAKVALKVFVILTTGNEAGSAAMFVERPAEVPLAA